MWFVADFSPVLLMTTAVAFRRRRSWRSPIPELPPPPQRGAQTEALPPTIEAAERQLGMLLRRMRAYQRSPYDTAQSRIRDEEDFERCLDLATLLSIRVTEFGGGLITTSGERERVRSQVLCSVSPNWGRPVSQRSPRPT